jgi:hypothetical protein
MASIVSAGTTSATALNMSADTSGILQLASNNGTVALTVSTGQNIGIGTASPAVKLDVTKSTGSGYVAYLTSGVNVSGSDNVLFIGGYDENSGSSLLNIQTNVITPNGSSFRQRFLVRGDGNVGIGTTAPASKLEINGNGELLRFDGSNGQDRSMYFRNVGSANTAKVFTDGTLALETNAVTPITFATQSSERMRVTSGGQLVVGSTVSHGGNIESVSGYFRAYDGASSQGTGYVASDGAGNEWHFGRNTSNGYYYVVRQTGTGMYMNTNSWVATSDLRAKENISPIENSLLKIIALNPVRFTFKKDGMEDVGFIAQEMYEHIPDVVDKPKDEEEMMGIAKEKLIPYLVKAIQELNAKVTALENK